LLCMNLENFKEETKKSNFCDEMLANL